MGLAPLPTSAVNSAGAGSGVGSLPAAMTVTETTVTDESEVGVGVHGEAGFCREGVARGEEDRLMWLVWPFQVWDAERLPA